MTGGVVGSGGWGGFGLSSVSKDYNELYSGPIKVFWLSGGHFSSEICACMRKVARCSTAVHVVFAALSLSLFLTSPILVSFCFFVLKSGWRGSNQGVMVRSFFPSKSHEPIPFLIVAIIKTTPNSNTQQLLFHWIASGM